LQFRESFCKTFLENFLHFLNFSKLLFVSTLFVAKQKIHW
jgi:hypothetical protein